MDSPILRVASRTFNQVFRGLLHSEVHVKSSPVSPYFVIEASDRATVQPLK